MFSARNIHFAILGIILGAVTGYVLAFYQVDAAADPQAGMPTDHPQVSNEEMLDLLRKEAEASPPQPEVISRYANGLFEAGRREESADWYRKAVEADPRNTDVRSLYGAVLFKIGRKAEAMTQLQTALTQDPRHIPSLHGLFIMALDSQEGSKAAEYLQQIEKIDPSYPGLRELKDRLANKPGI